MLFNASVSNDPGLSEMRDLSTTVEADGTTETDDLWRVAVTTTSGRVYDSLLLSARCPASGRCARAVQDTVQRIGSATMRSVLPRGDVTRWFINSPEGKEKPQFVRDELGF